MKADNFAYRAPEFNEINGNEIRILNGKALSASSKLFSLVSSTPMPDAAFGMAFRILVPPVLLYGYPWSRSGSVAVGQGNCRISAPSRSAMPIIAAPSETIPTASRYRRSRSRPPRAGDRIDDGPNPGTDRSASAAER